MPDYVLNFDGACEPNPRGWMTWAWVLYDAGGIEMNWCADAIKPQGWSTNNIAEYFALGMGLKSIHVLGLEVDSLLVRGDSKLVVNQLTGEWQCHNDSLRKLLDRCLKHLDGWKWGAQWIPREKNEAADQYGRQKYAEIVGRPMPERRRRSA